MNGIHDVGGMDGFGPIEPEVNEPVFHERWEGRVRAMNALLGRKLRIIQADESRHGIERIHPVYYLTSSYYQKWLLRMESMLIEKGNLTKEEVEKRTAELAAEPVRPEMEPYRMLMPKIPSTERRAVIDTPSGSTRKGEPIQPRFGAGDVVQVKAIAPLGHTRVPRYVRGRTGVVTEVLKSYALPDVKAHNDVDLYQPVYRVCFEAQELWGKDASPKDKLYIEMWEDYLEAGGTKA